MHDLYATMHIFQMVLPDAWVIEYRVKFFHNILGKLGLLRYEKIWLHTAQKASGKTIWKICIVA